MQRYEVTDAVLDIRTVLANAPFSAEKPRAVELLADLVGYLARIERELDLAVGQLERKTRQVGELRCKLEEAVTGR